MTTRYTRLSFAEREEISKGIYAREKSVQIAKRLNRYPSTITREIRLQVKKRRWCYSALKGEERAKEYSGKGGRLKKLEGNHQLLLYTKPPLKTKIIGVPFW